ncbi:MAG: hypothetical protein MK130_02015 [Puniceicoccaceae bacterium]|nr:hypothetical protein [Puniceicoccaceae bacterium]
MGITFEVGGGLPTDPVEFRSFCAIIYTSLGVIYIYTDPSWVIPPDGSNTSFPLLSNISPTIYFDGQPVIEPVIDSDEDGTIDEQDAFPNDPSEDTDTDGDNIGNNEDSDDDNDSILDDKEIEIGSNPLVADTLQSLVTIIDELILNNSSKLSIDEVIDLRPGSTMIEVSGNQATVQLQMEESSDLQSWEDTGDPATMTIPADTDTKFFRFKIEE